MAIAPAADGCDGNAVAPAADTMTDPVAACPARSRPPIPALPELETPLVPLAAAFDWLLELG
jgi:hypothetical protein